MADCQVISYQLGYQNNCLRTQRFCPVPQNLTEVTEAYLEI